MGLEAGSNSPFTYAQPWHLNLGAQETSFSSFLDTLNLIFDCSQSGAIFGFKVTFPHSKPVCDTHINVPQVPHTQNALF